MKSPILRDMVAPRAHRMGDRIFQPGEVFARLQFRDDADAKLFANHLRWRAFEIVPVDLAAALPDGSIQNHAEVEALRSELTAAHLSINNLELANKDLVNELAAAHDALAQAKLDAEPVVITGVDAPTIPGDTVATAEAPAPPAPDAPSIPDGHHPIADLTEAEPFLESLAAAGIATVEHLAVADMTGLTAIDGIGKATAKRLIAAAQALLQTPPAE